MATLHIVVHICSINVECSKCTRYYCTEMKKETLLDLPRTGDWTLCVSVTQTTVECACVDQLTAVSLCVVLIAVNTFTSTLQITRPHHGICDMLCISAVFAVEFEMCRPSVCPLRSGIVSKRLNWSSNIFLSLDSHNILFFCDNQRCEIPMGFPNGGFKHRWDNSRRSSIYWAIRLVRLGCDQ